MKQLAVFLCLFCVVSLLHAQSKTPSPIIFIYDASGSMWGQMEGKTKMQIATEVLSTSVNKLPDNQKIGLVAYGHRKKGDCKDVEFLVEMTNGNKAEINSELKKIKPLGMTPLAYSATQVIDRLRATKTKATIILVTDGIESCNGNICNVVQAAKKEGIDFRLHIIGFGLKAGETEQLKCAADAGDGQYYDAADASVLGEVLNEATSETIDNPAGNFSVYATKNGKPVDAWVKAFKAGTREGIGGARSYRDSAWVYLPPGKYDLEVRALENTDIAGTVITVTKKEGVIGHQTVSFDGGSLKVMATNNNEGWDATVKMKDQATGKVISHARTYGKEKNMEVNAGVYDVSFQALVMKGIHTSKTIENVEIKAGESKPLTHDFETGIAMIGVKTASGALIDATVNLKEIETATWVVGSRTYTSENNNPRKFLLNPGNYEVKVVTLGAHKGNSKTFTLEIKKGETTEKTITF